MKKFDFVILLKILLVAFIVPASARADFISSTESVLKRYERCVGSSKKHYTEFKAMFESVKMTDRSGGRDSTIEIFNDGPYTLALRNKLTREECYLTIHDECVSAVCVR